MTPQQIFDYKRSWVNHAIKVMFHSDIERDVIRALKSICPQQSYHIARHVAPYTHMLMIEQNEYLVALTASLKAKRKDRWFNVKID